MVRLLKVNEIHQTRTFTAKGRNGIDEQVTAVGLVVTNGMDTFYVEAYRDVATKVQQKHVAEGDLLSMKLSCGTRSRQTDNGVFYSNNIAVIDFDVMVPKDKTF